MQRDLIIKVHLSCTKNTIEKMAAIFPIADRRFLSPESAFLIYWIGSFVNKWEHSLVKG